MPYPTNEDAPSDVKRRFSGHCLTVWREVWNETFERHSDEGRAFATAETAGQKCKATKAEWDAAYVNDLPDSAFACPEQRKYPHHNAQGNLDLPHLRNALSRVAQDDTETCGVAHLRAHAKEAGVGDKTRAVKFVDGSDNIIEGLAIPYGGPFEGKDLDGEAFDPDTDLALEWFPAEGRPVLFHHGLDEVLKTALVGRQIERAVEDAGHWVKVQLDKRNRYYEQISQMVRDGLLAFSSGALGHLVKTEESGQIKTWPWVELSLTPTPSNPNAVVYAVKASDAIEHIAAVKSVVPEPIKAAVNLLEDGFTEQPSDSGPESFDAHAERVASEVADLAERTQKRFETRSASKVGRELSKANIQTLREAHRIIGELLERADRPDEQEAKAALVSLEALLELTA